MGPLGCAGAAEPRLPVRKLPMKEEAGEFPIRRLPAVNTGDKSESEQSGPAVEPCPGADSRAPYSLSSKSSEVTGRRTHPSRPPTGTLGVRCPPVTVCTSAAPQAGCRALCPRGASCSARVPGSPRPRSPRHGRPARPLCPHLPRELQCPRTPCPSLVGPAASAHRAGSMGLEWSLPTVGSSTSCPIRQAPQPCPR